MAVYITTKQADTEILAEVTLKGWPASKVHAFAALTAFNEAVAANAVVVSYTVEGESAPIFLPNSTQLPGGPFPSMWDSGPVKNVTSVTFGVIVEGQKGCSADAVFVAFTEEPGLVKSPAGGPRL